MILPLLMAAAVPTVSTSVDLDRMRAIYDDSKSICPIAYRMSKSGDEFITNVASMADKLSYAPQERVLLITLCSSYAEGIQSSPQAAAPQVAAPVPQTTPATPSAAPQTVAPVQPVAPPPQPTQLSADPLPSAPPVALQVTTIVVSTDKQKPSPKNEPGISTKTGPFYSGPGGGLPLNWK